MSKRERQYLDVMQRLGRHELTRVAACELLGISERHVYRLWNRYRADGDGGLMHRLRERSSNRGYGPEQRRQVVDLYRQPEFRDYGPQLFNEVLAARLSLRLSTETVRQWLMDAGLWTGRRAPRRHRKKRDRREAIGSLVQFDGSTHDWFEGRGPVCCLLVAIDDASSRVFMRFAPSEDTQHVMQTLWQYMERYGIPQSLYTDYGSVYTQRPLQRYTSRRSSRDTQQEVALTEVGRALRQLGVEMIFAKSPQAKGRVERSNRTHQDRLIKALRRERISSIAEANRYLDQRYLAEHNARYAAIDGKPDVHRTVCGEQFENIFCFEQARQVRNDYTVMLDGSFVQLERGTKPNAPPLPPPRTPVCVRRWLDGSLHIWWNEIELAHRILPGTLDPKPRYRPPTTMHAWRQRPVNARGRAMIKQFKGSG